MKRQMFSTVFCILMLCPIGFSTSTTQVHFKIYTASQIFKLADGNTAMIVVDKQIDTGGCGFTCTETIYSFCLDENPGCLEGFVYSPDSSLKGSVTNSMVKDDPLTLNAAVVSNLIGDPGTAYYCYAWSKDGNCTQSVPLPNGSNVGQITIYVRQSDRWYCARRHRQSISDSDIRRLYGSRSAL
jgi:hypothetical protein